MMDNYRWVLDFVERCYRAATDDDLWTPLLKDLTTFLECRSATLFFTDRELKPIDEFFSNNVTSEAIGAYQAHYHEIDIRMQRAIPRALDRIVTDRDLVDEEVVRTHAFYQDFLRPIGHRYVVSTMTDLGDGALAFCSCHRGVDQPHVESDVLEKAALVLPHVKRSLQLRRRLASVRGVGSAALDVLDRLGQAVFLIDGRGRIAWQNGCAGRLLLQRDGLITGEGELRALATATNTELQRLIGSALTAASQPKQKPGGMMAIARPSLKRSYQLLVTPLPGSRPSTLSAGALARAPSAVVFIMDPEDEPGPDLHVLSTFYSLTPAEAKLATALASGSSLKAYAERTRLSIHYVRWLLKQVEAKTDTRRIGDLTRLLAKQTSFFGDILKNT